MCKFQVKLHFTEKALRLISNKAMNKNTGARGLRAILETLLTDAMYEVMLVKLGLRSMVVVTSVVDAIAACISYSVGFLSLNRCFCTCLDSRCKDWKRQSRCCGS